MLDLADRTAIHELYARYSWAVDTNDVDAWVGTFTEDGVFAPDSVITGREAIARYARSRVAQRRAGAVRNTQHWIANLWLDGDGSAARGRCYLITIGIPVESGKPAILGTRWYRDSLRKVEGEWLFQRRDVPTDMPASIQGLWQDQAAE